MCQVWFGVHFWELVGCALPSLGKLGEKSIMGKISPTARCFHPFLVTFVLGWSKQVTHEIKLDARHQIVSGKISRFGTTNQETEREGFEPPEP